MDRDVFIRRMKNKFHSDQKSLPYAAKLSNKYTKIYKENSLFTDDFSHIISLMEGMQSIGIIKNYMIGGGAAALYYSEPITTDDVDIFFYVPSNELINMSNIFQFMKDKNIKMEKEHFIIGHTKMQMLPTEGITEDAINNPNKINYNDKQINIIKLEYLIAIYLKLYRPRDKAKLLYLWDDKKINKELLNSLLIKYGLTSKYERFKQLYEE